MGAPVLERDDRIGRWRLDVQLGQGAQGTTWRAVDPEGRTAALKLLEQPPGDELRALSRVCHPAVVRVLGGGGSPVPHLAMELARGSPLRTLLAEGALSVERTVALGAVLVDALAAVHTAGLSHGDVKPANLMVDGDRLWLVDFGLAGQETGGTLLYAAPEQIRTGQGPSPATDVYAAGLVIWECLHGSLPHGDLDPAEALARRGGEPPEARRGPGWLTELLHRMLATHPEQRPGAARAADAFAAHGAVLPEPDAELLQERAATLHVARPRVEPPMARWLDEGGVLAITGPSGSGRTHQLRQLTTELQARGRPWVRLVPDGPPWSAVGRALADPELPGAPRPLPEIDDPGRRALRAAELLVERSQGDLAVVVDDLDTLDAPSARALEHLARRQGIPVCVTARQQPDWATATCALEPFDATETEHLVQGMLGISSDLGPLLDWLADVAGGRPAAIVHLVAAAARQGALTHRTRTWHVDESRLDAVPLDLEAAEIAVGDEARQVGAFLALHEGPLPPATLAALAELDEQACTTALEELREAGLVTLSAGEASCANRAACRALEAACADPAATHRVLLDWLRTRADAPAHRLGWHAAGSGDPALAIELGPAAIAEAMERDVQEAADLAEALWQQAQASVLEGPRMRALVAAGRTAQARRFGTGLLARRKPCAADLPVIVELVRLQAGRELLDDEATAWIERARAVVGSDLPLVLVEAETQILFRAGHYDETIEIARSAGDAPPAEDTDAWLRLRTVLAQALHRTERLEEALELLETVPAALGEGRTARTLLEAARGRLLWHAGRLAEARQVLESAAGRQGGLPRLERARLLNNAAVAAYQTADRLGAVTLWEKALLLFERLEAPVEQVRVQTNLCVAYREVGRWERARLAGDWAVRRAAELDQPQYEAMAAGNMGDLHLTRGAWEEAQRWYDHATELAREHDLSAELVELARRRAELAVRRRERTALAQARGAEQTADEAGDVVERCRAAALVAVCLARQGSGSDADKRLAVAMATLQEADAQTALAEVRLWAAEAWLELGQAERALAEIPRVEQYARAVGHTVLRLRADRLARRIRGGRSGTPLLSRAVELAERVHEQPDIEAALQSVAEMVLALCKVDRSFVLLARDHRPAIAAVGVRSGSATGEPDWDIVRKTLRTRRRVLAADLGDQTAITSTTRAVSLKLRSVLCVPLLHDDRVLGALYLDSGTSSEVRFEEVDAAVRLAASSAVEAVLRHRGHDRAERLARQAREAAHEMGVLSRPALRAVRALLDEHDLPEELRAHLDVVGHAARQVLALAGSLDEARDADPRTLLDLGGSIARWTELRAPLARRDGVTLQFEGEETWVRGDRSALARAFANLLACALQGTPTGGTVDVRVDQTEGRARLVVRARGARPDPEDLGLAIVRRIAADHEGSLRVDADGALILALPAA